MTTKTKQRIFRMGDIVFRLRETRTAPNVFIVGLPRRGSMMLAITMDDRAAVQHRTKLTKAEAQKLAAELLHFAGVPLRREVD